MMALVLDCALVAFVVGVPALALLVVGGFFDDDRINL